jgi:protocatechuate 3,4-dioxygenase beta subunit
VPGALIEIWQANAGGKYRHGNDKYMAALDPNFGGGGRVISDAEGRYSFRTVRPGPYPFPNDGCAWRPAHIHLSLFGHAFLQRLVTQLYFEGDPLIRRCVIVNTIKDPMAIDSLVAKLDMVAMQAFDYLAYRFDVVLRGRKATPFEGA